ncbi:LOW QUALITY PROTEIN: pleckstrin homology domain-containing family O member 1-like [Thalassophryne amazonica]|uniref:LOW QUALITY PROTEIN: pleckstrin homology domain-containing family O member 1-like n=1 Tax=Thalassophryne amazonica TaxID=390379 RepID=UPI001471D73E|nr:LOW QUALITY PROTEIN: pleckstrin homology domain-containing family O member 1-like [Thalassophryne amazonica]
MKNKQGPQDPAQQQAQPDKVGWIRKFCGKGIFRDIWKNRFVVLKTDQLFICQKEILMKELGRADEVLELSEYERCEELKKNKSRSKKNLSKFRLQCCSTPGNKVPNWFSWLSVQEDKESWIHILNAAITRAKNRILDEVSAEDGQLSHPTRDRAKIPHGRRLPTRGHLLAMASTSDGILTLDLIQDDSPPPQGPDCCDTSRSNTVSADTPGTPGKSPGLPRPAPVTPEQTSPTQMLQPSLSSERSHCASVDEVLTHSSVSVPSIGELQELIRQKLQKTERLLDEVHVSGEATTLADSKKSAEGARAEAHRLLKEAAVAWTQAKQVLEEVKELRVLYQQLESRAAAEVSPLTRSNSTAQSPHHLM